MFFAGIAVGLVLALVILWIPMRIHDERRDDHLRSLLYVREAARDLLADVDAGLSAGRSSSELARALREDADAWPQFIPPGVGEG